MESWTDILLDFLGAQTEAEIKRILDSHSGILVGDAVDAQLAEFVELGRERGEEFVRMLEDRRWLLRHCRADGVERAFAEWSARHTTAESAEPRDEPRDVGRLLARLGELADPQHTPERIELLQQALAIVSPTTVPQAWADLQYALADSIRKDDRGDPAANLERAIGAFEVLVRSVPSHAAPERWATTQRDLGNAYLDRRKGVRADNVAQAIDHFRAGLDVEGVRGMTLLWGELQQGLGAAYLQGAQQDRPDDIELAIACFDAATTVFTRGVAAEAWGAIQNELGLAYLMRTRGSRADNVERAIDCFEASQDVSGHGAPRQDWATATHNLGTVYRHRRHGVRAENVEKAIALYKQALDVRFEVRRTFPFEWAETLTSLGSAYSERVDGDRAQNIEQAIGSFDAALSVFTLDSHPTEWATTQHELGTAYSRRILYDRATNLEESIRCSELALVVRTRGAFPVDWAATMNNLGTIHLERIDGDRAGNVDRAVLCLQGALEVFTEERFPGEWAVAQENLGVAYASSVVGSRTESIEQALECLAAARDHHAKRGASFDLARAEHNLAAAYQDRTAGEPAENRDLAVQHYLAARRSHSHEHDPVVWATTEHNLGMAYLARAGDGDGELAVRCLERSLEIRTRETAPLEWALTQAALGAAHSHRPRDAAGDNIRRAVDCYANALEVFGPHTFPAFCQGAASALGATLAADGQWVRAARTYRVAVEAADILYRASVGQESKFAEIGGTGNLHVRAADAMARASDLDDAVVTLERGRARVLGDLLSRDAADLAAVEAQDPAVFGEFQRAASDVRAVEARELLAAVRMIEDIGGTLDTGTCGRMRRVSAEALRRDMELALHALAEATERVRQVLGTDQFLGPPTIDDIAGAVEPAVPIVFLAATEAGFLVLAVTGQGGDTPVELIAAGGPDLTSTDLGALLVVREGDDIVGGYLPGQAGANHEWLETALDDVLPLLGAALEPLAVRVDELGASGVILIPCGHLALLPLHAAPFVRGDDRCLIDVVDVSYSPSVRVLKAARRRNRARTSVSGGRAKLAGVGNPTSTGQPSLEWAQIELEAVSVYFPGDAAAMYTGAATKEALLRAGSAVSHVHLACHGRFDPVSPLSSELLLAGRDHLSLRDILQDHPFGAARMVVTSGCQTAMSEFTHVPDEVIGLPAGLLQGGTPTVVGTLWNVADPSTALVMERFYRDHLVGDPQSGEPAMSPARALRRAQRWLAKVTAAELAGQLSTWALERSLPGRAAIADAAERFALDDPDDRPYASPYYWAPFVLVGVGSLAV